MKKLRKRLKLKFSSFRDNKEYKVLKKTPKIIYVPTEEGKLIAKKVDKVTLVNPHKYGYRKMKKMIHLAKTRGELNK